MVNKKKNCPNYNHGKNQSQIQFCPSCGEKFSSLSIKKKSCNEEKHKLDRKNRSLFCTDCGKNLNID